VDTQSRPVHASNWLRETESCQRMIHACEAASAPARLSPPLSTIKKSQPYVAWRSSSAPRLAETSSLEVDRGQL
jgi:hypothetical protein